jgi:DNA recombination protein RmuC
MEWLIGGLVGAVLGGLLAWLVCAARASGRLEAKDAELRTAVERRAYLETVGERIPELQRDLESKDRRIREQSDQLAEVKSAKESVVAQLAAERRQTEEKLKLVYEAQQALKDAFAALSTEALKANNQMFLDLAKKSLEQYQEGAKGDLATRQQAIDELVRPVREGLEKFDRKIQEIEKARVGAYEGLTQQVRSLLDAQTQLRGETANLVQALRSPVVRGRWGEIQLRRVVEMAGMLNHCDFFEQQSVESETGKLRPDLVVRLPGGKTIVVDSKAPIASYLDAMNAQTDPARRELLENFARLIRAHVSSLGRKAYWDQFDPSPELVVMFLPGEHLYGAALEHDPSLIEFGVEQKVVIATPTSLITLLRAVAYGWRQEAIARNAQEISALGAELYKRLSDMGGHWIEMGRNLARSVDSYNKAVGSLETRVLVTARRFRELGAAPDAAELDEIERIDSSPRALRSLEDD